MRKKSLKWLSAHHPLLGYAHSSSNPFLFHSQLDLCQPYTVTFACRSRQKTIFSDTLVSAAWYVITQKSYTEQNLKLTESLGHILLLQLANGAIADLCCSHSDNIFSSFFVFLVSAIHWNNFYLLTVSPAKKYLGYNRKEVIWYMYTVQLNFELILLIIFTLANYILSSIHLFCLQYTVL
jgi:hypothetical protein